MNDLEKYFLANTSGKVIHKWMHYFDVYERHLSQYRGKSINLLEIGVSKGGSLEMWRDYLGPDAKIYGVDIDPECKKFENEQISIMIGSQSDRSFLKDIAQKIPTIDILIDDGGHTMDQQITTFQELYPHINERGVYICEDLHTSYWKEFGGGLKKPDTFIEFSKNLVDSINAWHIKDQNQEIDEFTKSMKSIHYYDSMFVIEKGIIEKPSHKRIGIE
jgi:limonene-1,2-epoxide hydrolase